MERCHWLWRSQNSAGISTCPACTPAAAPSLDKNDRVCRDVACEESLFSLAPQAPARTWFHWPSRSVGSALCTTVLEFSSGRPLRQVLTNQPLQPVCDHLGTSPSCHKYIGAPMGAPVGPKCRTEALGCPVVCVWVREVFIPRIIWKAHDVGKLVC